MNWYVLYIKPRNEKKAALQLHELGVEVYCPLIMETHQWADRKKKVEVPLINSYIFVKLEEKDRNIVFECSGVIRYLFWLGKPAIVQDNEILILKKWLLNHSQAVEVSKLKPGEAYKVTSGYFKGKKGIIKEVNKNRLQLLLAELGVKITLNLKEANTILKAV